MNNSNRVEVEKEKSATEKAQEEQLFRSALLSIGQKPIADEIVALTRKWLDLLDKDNDLSDALKERLKKFERWEALADKPKAFMAFLELVSDAALDRYHGIFKEAARAETTYEELIEDGLDKAMKALFNKFPQSQPRIKMALAAFRDEMLAFKNRAK